MTLRAKPIHVRNNFTTLNFVEICLTFLLESDLPRPTELSEPSEPSEPSELSFAEWREEEDGEMECWRDGGGACGEEMRG